MGMEAKCRATCGAQTGHGTALLETSEILFRGPFRLRIPFKTISTMEVSDGQLIVSFPEGPAAFELGQAAAEKWRQKILNPPALMDKLGVKAGSRVSVDGVDDPAFLRELKSRGPVTARTKCDFMFFGADRDAALKRLPALIGRIAPEGAIWVIYPKGRTEIKEAGVIAAGRAAGLVDVKIASVSATHTGTKFVIPKSARGREIKNQKSKGKNQK
jgi:hypothetical protein